ncbi:MAG: mycothiol system anti-sigma-R factor [Acidobacteria bacterium]|nr:mycothiol system anti-sigma-R factor [Acidobacteriota bacterium]
MEDAETDCRAALKRLYAYLDGEVAGEDCSEIEAHLARCRPCLDEADFERELKRVIRRKCGETLPDGLADRVRARLRGMVEDG